MQPLRTFEGASQNRLLASADLPEVSPHEEDKDDLGFHEVGTVDNLDGNIHVGDTGLGPDNPADAEDSLVEVDMGHNLDEGALVEAELIEDLDL